MEIEEFDKQLKCVNVNGLTLNIEEKMKLKLAFEQIKSDFEVDHLLFWGKFLGKLEISQSWLLLGTIKDYYIVMTFDYSKLKYGFPIKRFFWCSSSNFIFATLP